MSQSNRIQFLGNRKGLRAISLLSLRQTILQTIEKRQLISLNYVLMSDDELLEINRTHLNHDTYTDIITFDLSENKSLFEAEIYISTERVQENAVKYESSFENEMVRVCMHGVLHCLGYKDKSQEEKKTMRKAEDTAINLYLKFKGSR